MAPFIQLLTLKTPTLNMILCLRDWVKATTPYSCAAILWMISELIVVELSIASFARSSRQKVPSLAM